MFPAYVPIPPGAYGAGGYSRLTSRWRTSAMYPRASGELEAVARDASDSASPDNRRPLGYGIRPSSRAGLRKARRACLVATTRRVGPEGRQPANGVWSRHENHSSTNGCS